MISDRLWRVWGALLLRELERQYDRGVRLRALRKRHRWRKADVAKLLSLGGWASPAQRRMGKLLKHESQGRGVIPSPKSFLAAVADAIDTMKRLSDPSTPPGVRRAIYKRTRWWPHLIEAAYRGELAAASLARGDAAETASETAEYNVGEAAGISRAEVHRLCCKVREEGRAWRAKHPSHGTEDDPAMTAAELKRHLEEGPRTEPRPS